MLTPDEHEARAKDIASLYPTAKPASELGPHMVHTKQTNWRLVTQQGVIMGVLGAVVFTLIIAFLRTKFNSTIEVQQAGILFIVGSLFVGLVVIVGLKAIYRRLEIALMYSVGVFWSGVVAVFGASSTMYGVLFQTPHPSAQELWTKLAVASIIIVIVTTAVMLIVGKLLERNKPKY